MADSHYLVLARKWRPQSFEDVVGQEHITRTLKNAISSGRIHHAFLFVGSRGIGKTTTARILAKALNCLASAGPTVSPCGTCDNCQSIMRGNNIDVIEIDGASNNGVEDVREIRDNIRMVPASGRYKVYIIDEVHQLSIAAFNALLKTLEEPPAHAIFVLATTEAHKIPATIISRCQRYDFRRVGTVCLVELLEKIVRNEGVQASQEALYAIARAAEGGVRDAESILDELITYCQDRIEFQDVFDVLGLVDWKTLHTLCDSIINKDVGRLLLLVEEVTAAGKDLSQFVQEILHYFRNLLVCKTAQAENLLHLPEEELQEVRRQSERFTLTGLIRLVDQFAELTKGFDSQLAQRIALESLLIRLAKVSAEVSVDDVLEKLLRLGAGGAAIPEGAGLKNAVPGAAPPPNPPEAGPAPAPPTVPATKERQRHLDSSELKDAWGGIAETLQAENLNLGIWAGQGQPERIEAGGVLVLKYAADHAQGCAYVQRPEHRQRLEELLRERFSNVASFRAESQGQTAPTMEAQESPNGALPAYASVLPGAARAALENPGIALLMDTFKGRIAEIKLPAAPQSDTVPDDSPAE